MKPPRPKSPEVCPVCGEDAPRGALACPQCGADHRSGWKEDAGTYDGTDVPGGDFDHDQFIREEFGSGARPAGIKPIWWITGIVLLVALGAVYLLRVR